MGTIRAFLTTNYRLAVLLLALALAAKALVPAGYMLGGILGGDAKVLTVQICADAQGTAFTKQIVVPHQGKTGESADAHGKAGAACAWSALSLASAMGADAALLALALVFILAGGILAATPPLWQRTHYLRPPLRGPPARA